MDLSNLGDSELQSLLNNMNQQQLMQLFGGSLGGGGGGSGGMGELAALGRVARQSNARFPFLNLSPGIFLIALLEI